MKAEPRRTRYQTPGAGAPGQWRMHVFFPLPRAEGNPKAVSDRLRAKKNSASIG